MYNNQIVITFDGESTEHHYGIVAEDSNYIYFNGHCGEWKRYCKDLNVIESFLRDATWTNTSSTDVIIQVDILK